MNRRLIPFLLGGSLLAACGGTSPPAGPATGAPSDAVPLQRACDDFASLRAAETGAPSQPGVGEPHVDRVRELFRRAGAFGLSGGFLVSRAGQVVALETCGFADAARTVPLRKDAVFDIGSLSKQFTAAAILALQDDGRLATSDLISRFFPDVPADKQAITVHQLLTHTAGLPHDVGEPDTLPARDEAVRQILQAPLLFATGAGQAYTNAGYALLAAIVEIASGEDFEHFLRTRLWLPAGLTHTGMVLADWSASQIAEGVTFQGPQAGRWPGAWGPDGPSWLMRGCGFVSSTLEDLARWTEALRTGRVLSHAARAALFHPHAREPGENVSFYGYGWQITAAPDGSCLVTHNGSAGIHYDVLGILPEQETVYVAFCTQQATPWKDFPERVVGVLVGTDDLEFPPVAEPGEPVEDFAGTYRLPSGASLDVRAANGALSVSASNAEALQLFCPWPPAEPEAVAALGDRSALVSSVLDGLSRGDLDPLAAHLPADVPLAGERGFWAEHWPRWVEQMGAYAGSDVIDTVRVDGALRTLALIRFARSSTVVGFVHSDGGKAFVDTMQRRFLRDVALAPLGGREFASFHPQTRRSTHVRFDGPPEARTASILNEQQTVVAPRVAAP